MEIIGIAFIATLMVEGRTVNIEFDPGKCVTLTSERPLRLLEVVI